MKVIKKEIRLSSQKYYETHLAIINGVLPAKLTPMEIIVLAAFMSLEGDIVKDDRFCTSARKIVKERLELSDGGLSNYFKALRTKKFIREDGTGKEVIAPVLIPEPDEQFYNFRLIKADG